jgi:hypothetical protein
MLRCEVDQAVFYRVEEEKMVALVVHVDDCSAMASSLKLVNGATQSLRNLRPG